MSGDKDDTLILARAKHIKFFKRHLQMLPSRLSCHDSSRVTILFFAISGLDLLNGLDEYDDNWKKSVCDWLYKLQILPDSDGKMRRCGFQGSTTLSYHVENGKKQISNDINDYKCSHIAMTYSAISTLIILGDDLSRLNRKAIAEGVKALQQADGSYCSTLAGSEDDMRFVYCAACICYMIKDWSGMDIEKTVSYILNCLSYDFGFGQRPGLESHGGITYCAVASLYLMNKLNDVFDASQLNKLKRWLVLRQRNGGFQGRPNKQTDTCYSFWVGATLKLLDAFHLIEPNKNRNFILSTQDTTFGGLSKWVDSIPDPLHTYLGLGGLSFLEEDGLIEVDPSLNISVRSFKRLHQIQEMWEDL